MLEKCLDLLTLSEKILNKAKTELKMAKRSNSKREKVWFDENQFLVHGLAWVATYVEALKQLTNWGQNIIRIRLETGKYFTLDRIEITYIIEAHSIICRWFGDIVIYL